MFSAAPYILYHRRPIIVKEPPTQDKPVDLYVCNSDCYFLRASGAVPNQRIVKSDIGECVLPSPDDVRNLFGWQVPSRVESFVFIPHFSRGCYETYVSGLETLVKSFKVKGFDYDEFWADLRDIPFISEVIVVDKGSSYVKRALAKEGIRIQTLHSVSQNQ